MLILAGEGVFFLPFVIPRIFRPTLLSAFDYSNTEIGSAFSVYGLVAAVSYFFGGPLADRLPVKKLIAGALVLTGVGGFYFASGPTYIGLLVLYAYWGFTTIFLLWAAMIKATRFWASEKDQGKAFGWLEGGRGLAAALIGAVGLSVFAPTLDGGAQAFGKVVAVVSSVVIGIGILAWFVFPAKDAAVERLQSLKWIDVWSLLRLPSIRLQALIIFCAYIGYKATDDLSLMASEVLGFSEHTAAQVGAAALWLRPLFPLLAGLVADRWSSAFKTMAVLFGLMVFGSLTMAWSSSVLSWTVLSFFLPVGISLMGVYGLRGLYFAGMEEAGVPRKYTGTAVGIMSVVGYLPDVFFSPLMGIILDTFPSHISHALVFTLVAISGAVGLLVAWRMIPSLR